MQAGQQGTFVFVVKQDQTVELRPVTVARTRGDESVMKTGVRPGETVVTDGQIRLVPGSRVSIKSGPGGARAKGGVMNLSEIFIKRPVTTTLIILGIMVFGVMSYRLLPVSDLPAIDFPTIQVGAGLPGASPETMASAVALPLEKQFATIAGVTSINSTSSLGSTNVTLQFDLSRNIDAAAQDVQAMIAKTARQLPPQMPAPPSYQKVNPGDQPVMFLVLHSASLPLSAVNEYAESTIAQRISMVNGVAQVNIFGAARYAVRVDVDPRKLAAHGLGIDEVAGAISNGERQPADRHDVRHRQDHGRPGQRSAAAAPPRTARRSSPTGTATRCGSATSRTSTTASKTTRTLPGIAASGRSISPSRSSRAPTSSPSATRSSSCSRPFASSCRRR